MGVLMQLKVSFQFIQFGHVYQCAGQTNFIQTLFGVKRRFDCLITPSFAVFNHPDGLFPCPVGCLCLQCQIAGNAFIVDAHDFSLFSNNVFFTAFPGKFLIFFVNQHQPQFFVPQPDGIGKIVNQVLQLPDFIKSLLFLFFQIVNFIGFAAHVPKPNHVAVNVAVLTVNA